MSITKETIHTENAPAAIGPYSQAVKHNGVLYVSGQIPLDPKTMEFAGSDIASQAQQSFKNLKAIVEAAGSNLHNTLKLNIFLSDLEDFGTVNEIMKEYFVEPFPARATLQVARLPKDALIEMDAIVAID